MRAVSLRSSKEGWLAWLLLMVGLLVSGIGCWQAKILLDKNLSSQLDTRAREAKFGLERQFNAYVATLRRLQAPFAGTTDLSRQAFQKAIHSLAFENRLSGVQAAGFVQRQEAATKDAPESFIIQSIELPVANRHSVWLDRMADQKQRAAIEQARDSGESVAIGRVRRSAIPARTYGVTLFLPLYRDGATTATIATIEQRRKEFSGVALLTIRAEELLRGVLDTQLFDGLYIDIQDAQSAVRSATERSTRNPVPESGNDSGNFSDATALYADSVDAGLQARLPLQFGGSMWQLNVTALPKFISPARNWLPPIVFFAGSLLSLIVFFFTRMLDLSRRSPDAHAQQIKFSLHSKEQQLAGIMESIDEVLWTFDFPGWKINYVSPAVERVYGRSPEAFYADPNLWLKSVHPADRQRVIAMSRRIIETGRKAFQYRIVRPDGEVRWIRYDAHFVAGASAGAGRIDSVGTDITLQRRLEESLRRSNRALRAIHDCERVISSAVDENTLLQGICDVVAAAGYRMAWAGIVCNEGGGSIVPAGITGEHQGYLECLRAPLQAGVSGIATIGEALRTRRPVIVSDFRSDTRLAAWREEALSRGFNAKIALPLFDDIETIGVLNVYTMEQDAFDAEEVELLQSLAQRVTAAIQTHRHRNGRQTAEAALRIREKAIEASTNSIMIASATAPDFAVEYVNPAFERMTGYTAAEVVGRSCRALLGEEGEQQGIEEIRAALREKRGGNAILRNYRKDGTLFWHDLYLAPVKDEDGEVGHFVVTQYDITAMKHSEAELQHQAHHDALTGLPNRVLLQDRLSQAIAYSSRHAHPIWLVFVDLDRFKFVNDSLGHRAGDILLKTVAERLRAAVRETDTVARLGGDEFVLILPERTDGAAGLSAATVQRILEAVAQPLTIDEHEFFPTCSIGVATYPNDGKDAETLMMHADIAMYRAKEMGRNNYQFYAASMNEKTLERLHLEGELRRALARDEFVLHYQPQVDLRTGHIVGMEALIRWHHPELGMVPPARFIGLAEETGLIVPIGDWVLRTACAQNKAWQRAGLGHLRMAVNLSARQFAQQDLVMSIASALEETGLAANYLELELTESLVMSDVERTVGTLRNLKTLGVQLSIDDFGTGYSSLSYLKRFPIDVLKIDQSFVRDITVNPDDAAIVASIISLSHNLKLHVIAEGVETKEQLAYLRRHGCDEMQGYYFSKPVSAEAFEQILRKGRNLSMEFDHAAA